MHTAIRHQPATQGTVTARGWGRVTAGGASQGCVGGLVGWVLGWPRAGQKALFGDNQALHMTVIAMPKNEG